MQQHHQYHTGDAANRDNTDRKDIDGYSDPEDIQDEEYQDTHD
jgi:hypothetical protein